MPMFANFEAMKFVIRILISTLAVLITCYILPDRMVKVDGFVTALIVAAALAFLNAVVKPILIVLTIPITMITLGLFLLAINAGMILLADRFIDGFYVGGFWSALLFSILLSVVTSVFEGIRRRDEQRGNRPDGFNNFNRFN
jgi:putative membrane protein